MPVFLRPPQNCAGAGIGQLQFEPNEEGLIEIPDGVDYAELLNHGFTPVSEADLVPMRLKIAEAEEKRIQAEVQKRVASIMGGKPVLDEAAIEAEVQKRLKIMLKGNAAPGAEKPLTAENAENAQAKKEEAPAEKAETAKPAEADAAKPKK